MNRFRTTALVVSLCALATTAYLVRKGDTLWDLSGQFQGNPFSWPDLWENNKHIQDPHWIYPGDSLCIPGADSACPKNIPVSESQAPAAPVTAYPCPTDEESRASDSLTPGVKPTCAPGDRDADFKSKLGSLHKVKETNLSDSTVFYYNHKRTPKIFNAYYQRLAPRLAKPADFHAESYWYSLRSGEKKEPILHSLEHEVVVGYGSSQVKSLKAGDLAELWLVEKTDVRQLKGNGSDPYVMLRLAAIARITAVGDTLSRASIVQSFRPLELQKARSRPMAKYPLLEVRGYQPVPEAKIEDMASIRLSMDPGLVVGPYSYVMIDKGSAEGFRTGSGVAFWEEDRSDASLPPRLLGKGIVAKASEHESAVLVREIYSHMRRLSEGHRVSLTHLPVLK